MSSDAPLIPIPSVPAAVRQRALTVSTYVNTTNRILNDCGLAVVAGELTALRRYSSLFFNLSDGESVISCLIFPSLLSKIPFPLEEGQKVIVVGRGAVYPKNGGFSLQVRSIYLDGEGDILERIERLRKKLEAEGLFAEDKKRALPRFVKTAGLVTSAEGAVLHDLRRTVLRRNPLIKLKLFETRVQGPEAPVLIIKALKSAYADKSLDVIVLARGGGSREDLLPFSDEQVVRQTASSPVPIISAIGHEPDTVLTDYAADVRAATPTAAAELISSPTLAEIFDFYLGYEAKLTFLITDRLNRLALELDTALMRLKKEDPALMVLDKRQRLFKAESLLKSQIASELAGLNERHLKLKARLTPALISRRLHEQALLETTLANRLKNALLKEAALRQNRLQGLDLRLKSGFLERRLAGLELLNSRLEQRLLQAVSSILQQGLAREGLLMQRLLENPLKARLHECELKLTALTEKMIALNPLQVLQRGYSVTLKDGSKARTSELRIGDELETLLEGGRVYSTVTRVLPD